MKKTLIFLSATALFFIVYGIATQKPSMIFPGYLLMIVMGMISIGHASENKRVKR